MFLNIFFQMFFGNFIDKKTVSFSSFLATPFESRPLPTLRVAQGQNMSKVYFSSTKGTVFFFSAKVQYSPHFWKKSIGWMKKLFFFRRRKRKALRSNERMANKLSMGKKYWKNIQKFGEKNTIKFCMKKVRHCQELNEWPMNCIWKKRNGLYFFCPV